MYGLAEGAAEFVYGRLQAHPEDDSWREHWREVMEIIQKTRQRKMSAVARLARVADRPRDQHHRLHGGVQVVPGASVTGEPRGAKLVRSVVVGKHRAVPVATL
jgi:hypothetical protein